MLIPESLLRIDETVEDIIENGDDLTQYYDDIDSEIKSASFDVGVAPSDIPVDENGYVTSMRLQRLGKFYGLYRICRGYNGIGSGDLDDVYARWENYYSQYKEEYSKLTINSITGGAETDTPALGMSIRQIPVII